MHQPVDNFFKACKSRVLSRVAESNDLQLSSTNIIESLKKETVLEIPYLEIDNLSDPEIGKEYFEAPDAPKGIDLPEGAGNVYFVL